MSVRSEVNSAKREGSERLERFTRGARSGAEKAATGTRKGLIALGGLLVAVAVFLGGVLPWLIGEGLSLGGLVIGGIAAGFVALGGWFRSHSDDKGERMVWLTVIVVGAIMLVMWFGGG